MYKKSLLGFSFLLRQGQDFLLEIHNHSHHTFSQYSKEGNICLNGSSFVISLNSTQARLFTVFRSRSAQQERVFCPPPPIISETIQASPVKLIGNFAQLRPTRIQKEIFRNLISNVTMTSLLKTMGKF